MAQAGEEARGEVDELVVEKVGGSRCLSLLDRASFSLPPPSYLCQRLNVQIWVWCSIPFPVKDPYVEEPPWRSYSSLSSSPLFADASSCRPPLPLA